MAQNTRTELKNKFKRGMYPTEGDFANVFDSYVHKDDMVELEKVVQTIGNEQKTLATIINESKQEAIAAAVQQAAEKVDLSSIESRLKTAEDDIDAAEDNIAGHEERIKTLESSKNDYEEFKERVRAFLEDADNSDETINRWHEIENFLQGITDTKTLTGLLQDLKTEILAEIPEPQSGNYLKQIPDLDGYTEAQAGEIVQYIGQTNENYTRGYIYERKVTEEKTYSAGIKIANFDNKNIVDNIVINGTFYEDSTLANQYGKSNDYYAKCKYQLKSNGDDTYTKEDCTKDIYFYRSSYSATEPLSYVIIDGVYHKLPTELQTASLNSSTNKLYSGGSSYVYVPTADLWINIEDIKFSNSSGYFKNFINSEGDILQYDPSGSMWNDFHRGIYISKDGIIVLLKEGDFSGVFSNLEEEVSLGGSSWQVLPVSPVIQ